MLCFYKIKKKHDALSAVSVLNRSTSPKMNRNSANTCLTYMINISIESFKLLLNEIKQIENKNSFIIIIIYKDALLKTRLMRRWRARIVIFILVTRTQKTLEYFVNNLNISLLFPLDTFMVIITFAGPLRQALAYCVFCVIKSYCIFFFITN